LDDVNLMLLDDEVSNNQDSNKHSVLFLCVFMMLEFWILKAKYISSIN